MNAASAWRVRPIKDFAAIGTGAKDTQNRIDDGRYPFFVRSQRVERINTYSFDGEAVLTAGDGVGTGKVFHYINGKFDYHQRVYRISNFRPSVLGKYFFYQFSRNFLARIESLTAKSSVDSVRMETIAGMEIAIPSIEEQHLIVHALDDASDLIHNLEKLIAKKRAIKRGMMQEILTGRTRLPGFSGEWSTGSLSTFGSFLRGRGIKRDEVRPSGVPCIRYGEIYTTYSDYTASTVSFVSESVAATALPIRSGDILFAASGETKAEIGMSVAYVGEEPAVAGSDIIVLRGSNYDPSYLASFLNTPVVANQKARGGQGDAVVHINWRVLAGLELTVPPFAEQQAIGRVLRDADAEIGALERRLEATRAIKQGMMQELLTGRMRLVPTEAHA